METTNIFYNCDLLPLSLEKRSFLASFTREATDDNRNDVESIQFYLDILQSIPNYETLNVKMLWVAFRLVVRLDESKRASLLTNTDVLFNLLCDDNYASELIKRLLPLKIREDRQSTEVINLTIKLRAQTYSYMRLILECMNHEKV